MNPGWGPFLAQTQAYRMVLVKTYINTERVGLVHTDRPNENDLPPIRREVILAYCYPYTNCLIALSVSCASAPAV